MAQNATENTDPPPTSNPAAQAERKPGTPAGKTKRAAAAARKTAEQETQDGPPDAIALLTEDHRAVQKLFEEYEKIKDGDNKDKKLELAENMCLNLSLHMQIEEEIFYPAVKKIDKDEVNEGIVEHAAAKDLIEQIEEMQPSEELFDSKVHVLSEEINHHVKEEETEMFPAVRKAGLDIKNLGEQLAKRKQELIAELAG